MSTLPSLLWYITWLIQLEVKSMQRRVAILSLANRSHIEDVDSSHSEYIQDAGRMTYTYGKKRTF
jgi:hypothetical protein